MKKSRVRGAQGEVVVQQLERSGCLFEKLLSDPALGLHLELSRVVRPLRGVGWGGRRRVEGGGWRVEGGGWRVEGGGG